MVLVKKLEKKFGEKDEFDQKCWSGNVFGLKQFCQKQFVSKIVGDFCKDLGSNS